MLNLFLSNNSIHSDYCWWIFYGSFISMHKSTANIHTCVEATDSVSKNIFCIFLTYFLKSIIIKFLFNLNWFRMFKEMLYRTRTHFQFICGSFSLVRDWYSIINTQATQYWQFQIKKTDRQIRTNCSFPTKFQKFGKNI